MTKNPILNALAAIGYVVIVASFMSFIASSIPEPTNPLAPLLMMLSLFVFSAATMAYLVLSAPLQLFIDGQKKEAISLFLKTLVIFAAFAIVLSFAAFLLPL